MALNSVLTFLIPLILLTTATTATTTVPLQINKLISAVIWAGNFENWATILSSNPSFLPPNFTLFLPSTRIPHNPNKQNPLSTISYYEEVIFYDKYKNSSSFKEITQELQSYFLLLYHIVPHRLSYDDLVRFPVNTHLPTLLPGYTLLITVNDHRRNGFSCNISVGGSCVSLPHLFQDETAFAHGVDTAIDYTIKPIEKNPSSWTGLLVFPFLIILNIQLLKIRDMRRQLMEIEKELQRQKTEHEEDKRKWEEYERQNKIDEEKKQDELLEKRQEEMEKECEYDEEHDEELRRQYDEDTEEYWINHPQMFDEDLINKVGFLLGIYMFGTYCCSLV